MIANEETRLRVARAICIAEQTAFAREGDGATPEQIAEDFAEMDMRDPDALIYFEMGDAAIDAYEAGPPVEVDRFKDRLDELLCAWAKDDAAAQIGGYLMVVGLYREAVARWSLGPTNPVVIPATEDWKP